MADEMKPAYLIAGTDSRKIDDALVRLRKRAESGGGGSGALMSFSPKGNGMPDLDGLLAELPAMSLTAERRYLLAEQVQRWKAKQLDLLAAALADPPPMVTTVLVGTEKPAAKLVAAVEKAGGEVLIFEAPNARQMPSRLVEDARKRGYELEPAAARVLVDRLGTDPIRLGNELDRLALWVEADDPRVTYDDLTEMIHDTSEEVNWTLSDAMVSGRADDALSAADRLIAQGESPTSLVYAAAKRLREAHQAVVQLEAGRPAAEVEKSLSMHPFAAKKLVQRVRGTSPTDLRRALAAMADLEYWTRGGSDYDNDVALALAVRKAAGVQAREA